MLSVVRAVVSGAGYGVGFVKGFFSTPYGKGVLQGVGMATVAVASGAIAVKVAYDKGRAVGHDEGVSDGINRTYRHIRDIDHVVVPMDMVKPMREYYIELGEKTLRKEKEAKPE